MIAACTRMYTYICILRILRIADEFFYLGLGEGSETESREDSDSVFPVPMDLFSFLFQLHLAEVSL